MFKKMSVCVKGSADTQHPRPYRMPSWNAILGRLNTGVFQTPLQLVSGCKCDPAIKMQDATRGRQT